MERGFYIHSGSKTDFVGINKKIEDQRKVFSGLCDMKEIIVEKEKTNPMKSVVWRLPGGSWGRKYDEALQEMAETVSVGDDVLFLYIRYDSADRRYIRFLSDLRRTYPMAKIVIEVPTFPYQKELLQSRTMWPWYFKDRYYVCKIHNYVDRIVTYSFNDVIHGVPTIRTMNGIDCSRITPVTREKEKTDLTIRMLAVAQFQPSHGYERLIKGLEQYYAHGGKREIELHMVGDGTESEKYKKWVNRLGLQDRVFFYGGLTGKELDECYENKDVAVGGLGLYKRGIRKSSALKVREYLAKGLPVVSGAPNDAFSSGGKEFCLVYPNDATPVSIDELLRWYDALMVRYKSRLLLAQKIRSFAESAVDISITMKPVIKYISEGD